MLVKQNTRGFTVIELITVVTIIAILAAVALPSFRNIFATSRIKTAAADLHLSLVRARSEAAKRNINVTVQATSGWIGGWTVSSDIESHGAISGEGITISSSPTSVTFTPNGRATANPIKISFTSTNTSVSRCVSISLSGQPIIKPEACS